MPFENKGNPEYRGGGMLFPDRTIEKAKFLAHQMVKDGEVTRPLMTENETILAYVSSDAEAIRPLTSFVVGGKTFYLGNEK